MAVEVEPGERIVAELERLATHPRKEAERLGALAEVGEDGLTPFVEIARVAAWVVPIVLVVLGVVLTVYYVA